MRRGKKETGRRKGATDAKEVTPKEEGQRGGAEEDEGAGDTPERNPDSRQDTSSWGPPKAWQHPRSPAKYKVRYPDPPNIHRDNEMIRTNR